ncbi:ABC-three component system middle component 2 [Flexibacterium corallicola]|uniref:ABC-three component system middle component 2 n=1 Tax=Flexibacterium corallicola TaxID=3037259 RepID=UPI00286F39EC|nr:ABC-three component system middle component 2 [Pseudovibrio sp. M1P-2-3]
MSQQPTNQVYTFNGPFETGMRSLCLLAVDLSLSFDLQQLSAFDYLVVHTGDFDAAPPSLHPDLPSRSGELVIRRELVERGLNLMESKGLVKKQPTQSGFWYLATELAKVVLDSLQSPYVNDLRERANWVIGKYLTHDQDAFSLVFNRAFDQWSTEFQFEQIKIAGS